MTRASLNSLMIILVVLLSACSKSEKLAEDDALIGYWQFKYYQYGNGIAIQTKSSQDFISVRIKSSRLIIEKNNDKVCSCSIRKYRLTDTYYLGNGCSEYLGDDLRIKYINADTLVLDNYPFDEASICNRSSYCQFLGNTFTRVD